MSFSSNLCQFEILHKTESNKEAVGKFILFDLPSGSQENKKKRYD